MNDDGSEEYLKKLNPRERERKVTRFQDFHAYFVVLLVESNITESHHCFNPFGQSFFFSITIDKKMEINSMRGHP